MAVSVDVVVTSVSEYKSHRRWTDGEFGAADGAWATRVGITLANSRLERRGRGYWPGAGGWRMPRFRKHPVPLGVVVELDVVSDRWARKHEVSSGEHRLVLVAWSVESVISYVTEHATMQNVPMEDLEARLGRYFEVEDIDAD